MTKYFLVENKFFVFPHCDSVISTLWRVNFPNFYSLHYGNDVVVVHNVILSKDRVLSCSWKFDKPLFCSFALVFWLKAALWRFESAKQQQPLNFQRRLKTWKLEFASLNSQSWFSLCIKSYQIFIQLTMVAATSKMIEMFAIDVQNLLIFHKRWILLFLTIFVLTQCFVCKNAYIAVRVRYLTNIFCLQYALPWRHFFNVFGSKRLINS